MIHHINSSPVFIQVVIERNCAPTERNGTSATCGSTFDGPLALHRSEGGRRLEEPRFNLDGIGAFSGLDNSQVYVRFVLPFVDGRVHTKSHQRPLSYIRWPVGASRKEFVGLSTRRARFATYVRVRAQKT